MVPADSSHHLKIINNIISWLKTYHTYNGTDLRTWDCVLLEPEPSLMFFDFKTKTKNLTNQNRLFFQNVIVHPYVVFKIYESRFRWGRCLCSLFGIVGIGFRVYHTTDQFLLFFNTLRRQGLGFLRSDIPGTDGRTSFDWSLTVDLENFVRIPITSE